VKRLRVVYLSFKLVGDNFDRSDQCNHIEIILHCIMVLEAFQLCLHVISTLTKDQGVELLAVLFESCVALDILVYVFLLNALVCRTECIGIDVIGLRHDKLPIMFKCPLQVTSIGKGVTYIQSRFIRG
jgi:hypothetical protein